MRLHNHVYMLSNNDKLEVNLAMSHLKGKVLGSALFLTYRLTMHSLTRELAMELHDDTYGFFIVHVILRYFGISSYVADKIGVQDEYGNVFAHVREAKYTLDRQEDRLVRDSALSSHFHTDEACDIVAMHTSGHAAEGGEHIVASSLAVYEILFQNCPEVVSALMEAIWHLDTRGRLAQGQARPILYKHGNRVIFNFNKQALRGVPGIQPLRLELALSSRQLEALNAVEAAVRQVQSPLKTQLGDMAFVNSLSMLHSRKSFRDSPSETRHLVRPWLKNFELAYSLPSPIGELNARLFDELVKRTWNVLPKTRLAFTFAERLGP
ncbi:hypothetical protein QBC36DRAFT_355504 [Triangularia setosa]|uniref:TauD/TfdA-like domain-containing protein n=1 Tax=Triangularia setosa TaxID=2587417 RepID=A0AAN6W4R7_9PEZI|nr:hypothetical protein QBC36DRAFT_355504 [Podospora setosa]